MITRDQAKIALIQSRLREIVLDFDPCDCIFNRVIWAILAELVTGEIDNEAIRLLVARDQDDAANHDL